MNRDIAPLALPYEAWLDNVPAEARADAVWKVSAYRLGLYASDCGWRDVVQLDSTRRTQPIAGQLYRALGSIGANVTEGFSRSTGADRARFFEYALGSARESRHWYLVARPTLGDAIVAARDPALTDTVRLLLTMIGRERERASRRERISGRTKR